MAERSEAVEEQAVRDASAVYAVKPEIATAEDVPPGYKRTEVGVIPEEWSVKTAAELGQIVTGGTPPTNVLAYWGDEYPWVTPTDITERKDIDATERHITTAGLRAIRSLPPKSVLVTCIASIGKNAVLQAAGGCNQQINAVIPGEGNESDFLYYLFEFYKTYLVGKAGTTATSIISKGIFSGLQFAIPQKEEQRAIATALSDADALIESLDRLIAKKRAIKQAAMQQLLTGQTRLPGFTGEWETKRLGDVGKIVTGGTPSTLQKSFWGGPYPWVTPTDISSGRDIYSSERQLTEAGLEVISELPSNAVLVTCIASIGKNAILKKQGGCNQQINAIILSSSYSPEFLYYLIDFSSSILKGRAGTTATSILSKSGFSDLEFNFPGEAEQNAIVSVLSDMDAELESLERRRDKARQIKQGMMQQLLTGRVRLVTPEVAA